MSWIPSPPLMAVLKVVHFLNLTFMKLQEPCFYPKQCNLQGEVRGEAKCRPNEKPKQKSELNLRVDRYMKAIQTAQAAKGN